LQCRFADDDDVAVCVVVGVDVKQNGRGVRPVQLGNPDPQPETLDAVLSSSVLRKQNSGIIYQYTDSLPYLTL
jgi:hypothetical protein